MEISTRYYKPYKIAEVIVRVKRILWRSHNTDSKQMIKCGDLVIDLDRYEVSLSGKLIPLTFKEYELLRFLATNKGKVLTREILLDKLWGYDYYGGDRTVDVHVRRLRAKIEDENHCFIETVRSAGYRFIEE
jgi:DNA-binding response OmpR family regulator